MIHCLILRDLSHLVCLLTLGRNFILTESLIDRLVVAERMVESQSYLKKTQKHYYKQAIDFKAKYPCNACLAFVLIR